jgi:uncharacterized membrane protein
MKALKESFKALPKWIQILLLAVLSIFGVTIFGCIFGYIIMWLWNQLMPQIFGLPIISYWQGIGLFILARILLGTFASDNSNKSNIKSTKKTIDTTRDPDWVRYNTWWEKEGKTAFENYTSTSE